MARLIPPAIGVGITVLLAGGCQDAARPAVTPEPKASARAQELPPGSFRVASLAATGDGETRYLATVEPPCSFEIAIGKGQSGRDAEFDFSFARATLARRPQSDCRDFLVALAPTLGFEGRLPAPASAQRVSLTLAILGTNLSRSPSAPRIAGEFTSTPAGDWTATKLFFADGEGEVFFNLNPKAGIGEFSIKDEEYAGIVMTELAKVLLPEG